MSEFIYILENSSFPGVVKIGRTDREVTQRVKELSSATGVPTEFTVFKQYAVEDSITVERRIHELLAKYRLSDNREFFKLTAEEAAATIEELICQKPHRPDYDREDKLFAAATEVAISLGKIEWPSNLTGCLKISYDEAVHLIQGLQARGILNNQNELCPDLRPEHKRRIREARKKQQAEECERLEKEIAQYEMILRIRKVRELLAGLYDPETGEAAEVSFENDNGNLVVAVRGTEWVRSEAQRLLASVAAQ
jgi:hypothetical protein